MAEPLRVGVTYLPAETGIHMWQEWTPARAAHDLALIRSQGFARVRVHLAWDAFMPTHRQVDRHRLGELGGLLESARQQGIACVLVVGAQSHGDCIQLPGYAVDRARRRPGVRVVVDGTERDGGPRDLWSDPLMLEAVELWLRTLLDAFANHPAVAAWDLGHDPAATLRPRRTAHFATTIALLADVVRRRQDPVRLTLGAGDVLTARGVRLHAVAGEVDSLGLLIDPQRLPLAGSGPAAAAFTLALAQRLASVDGRIPALDVVTGVAAADDPKAPPPLQPPRLRDAAEEPPGWDVVPLTPAQAATVTSELIERLAELGAGGLEATSWCLGGPRPLTSPPWDRLPALGCHGIATVVGELRAPGEVWSALARREPPAAAPTALPGRLDIEAYYANLPDSARELQARWGGGAGAAADTDGAASRG